MLYGISEVGLPCGGEQRLDDAASFEASKKIVPSPDNREQEDTMTVYGGTGEVAMNAGHTEILFLASNRASIAIV
ncbi:hypothetical protein [Rhizobium ruizarguesonis]|uniref:hypothetical protein n=1 Tax=Rhizobium ruizarguesonis TaxID=2081791 RepID=UPI0013DD463E|nr:hypothetical protein [Rhizobium ruizarguesonis]